MEPSVERRDHIPAGQNPNWPYMPQWSPPLIGGSTLDGVTLTFAPTTQLQWSPPLERREYGSAGRWGRSAASSRNGARR